MAADVPVASLIDSLGPLCERARSQGLRVLLEFMPEGSIPDLATALAIVRATGAVEPGGHARHLALLPDRRDAR